MAVIVSNHDFTHGELDKTLFARSDLTFYNKGARKCQNFITMPGGGVRTRFGTRQDDLVLPTLSDNYQMFSWRTGYFDYLIVFSDINTDGIVVYNLTDLTDTAFLNPYNSLVPERQVQGAQNQDEYVVCCPADTPFVFTSDEVTGAVTFTEYSFKYPPTYDYENDYDDWTFHIADVAVTSGTAYTTLTCTAGTEWGGLTADYVGGVFEALGPTTGTSIGRARIISVNVGAQTAQIEVISAFDQNTGTTEGEWPGTQCYIAGTAYNVTKGWPRAVAFFEDRLIFAGGGGVPQSLFFSAIGDFRDFDPATGLDSDSIAYTLASGAQDAVINIVSGRSLQVFTTSSEMATPVWGTTALTPSTVALRQQTANGSTGVTPPIIDNSTLFVKRGGRAVMAYTVSSDEESYNSEDVSVMSSHLIQNPVELAAYTVNEAFDSNLVLGINADSSMFIYETLAEQGVSAWTSTQSNGDWKNVCVVDDQVFFIAKRNGINLLEELDWLVCLDCYQTYTASSTGEVDITVTAPLSGTEVQIVTDIGSNSQEPEGTFVGTFEADADTIFNVPVVDGKVYYIGYKFTSILQTMAAQVQVETGDTLYIKKRNYKCYIDYVNSYPFTVNDVPIPMSHLWSDGSDDGIILDAALPPSDGIFALPTNKMGWDRRVFVTCQQDDPLPVMIIGIGVEISV